MSTKAKRLLDEGSGNHKENVELMRNALKTYPNDALLLIQLSASLERLDGTEKEKIIKILGILFDGNESDFIAEIRQKASN